MKIDISQELQIQKYLNGIQLTQSQSEQYHHVGDWLANSFSVYFINTEQNLVEINDHCLANCGYDTRQNTLGKSWKKPFPDTMQIHSLECNNQQVMHRAQTLCLNERIRNCEEEDLNAITIKMPWYDLNGNVLGLFGCSLNLNTNDVAELTNNLNFIKSQLFFTTDEQLMQKYGFTERELQVVRGIVRGHTIREVSERLCLSIRTIEFYFNNIKLKLGLNKKSQVIALLYDDFK